MFLLFFTLAILGLAVGSFLTVVVSRFGTGETLLWGRSHCPHCRATLHPVELIPFFSFLWQRGRCRACAQSITFSYPLVELTTASLFLLFGWFVFNGYLAFPVVTLFTAAARPWVGPGLAFLYYAFFAAIAVATSAYDIERRMIPMAFTIPLAVVGAGSAILGAILSGEWGVLAGTAAVAVCSFFLLWAFWYWSKGRAMGRGDADVAAAIAIFLGPEVALLGLLFAFWSGAVWGILQVVTGRLGWQSQIPFAPFLFAGAIGALVTLPFAPHLIAIIHG